MNENGRKVLNDRRKSGFLIRTEIKMGRDNVVQNEKLKQR